MRLAALLLVSVFSPAAVAQSLTGRVTSADEGAMEGVLVSAKQAGSTVTVTVVSDAKGRYSFPAAKLEPGSYALRIRAAGYELDGPATVEVAGQKPTTLDLKLRKAPTSPRSSPTANG